MIRAEVTEKILSLKRLKGLSWKTICAEIGGGSPTYLTAALLGQMKLRPDQAERAAKLFGLGEEETLLLREVPYRGSLPTAVPTDPLIYRFYELVSVYGVEGADPGGIRRRHHERDRFRHGDRAPARPEGRPRQGDDERQVLAVQRVLSVASVRLIKTPPSPLSRGHGFALESRAGFNRR
jgi:hypothetical protein